MAFWDFVTVPFRRLQHGTGFIARAAGDKVASTWKDHKSMGNVMFQLQSFEAREEFDAQGLAAQLIKYEQLRRRLMNYAGLSKNGTSIYLEKIQDKYGSNTTALKAVIESEVGKFIGYFEAWLAVVSEVEMIIADEEVQQNSAIINDQDKLMALINKIPQSRSAVVLGKNFDNVIKKAHKNAKKDIKKIKKRFNSRKKLVQGKKNPIGFWKGLLLNKRGVRWLSNKAIKTYGRMKRKDLVDFHEHFSELRRDIELNKMVKVETISTLKLLVSDLGRIMRYYQEIDEDNLMIVDHMFKNFDEVSEKAVGPMYGSLQAYPEAVFIKKENEKLKQKYKVLKDEMMKEEYDEAKINKHLEALVLACSGLKEQITSKNKAIMEGINKDFKLPS